VSIEWLAFRKQTRLGKRKQEEIKAFVEDMVEKQLRLESMFYPTQDSEFPERKTAGSPEDAERAAQQLREKWKLDNSPIDSLVQMVEDKGGFVVECSEAGVQFDGLSGHADGRPVVVANREAIVDRYRYNVAHELGHVMMDCPGLSTKEEESLAHRFAAALLVPRDVAVQELGKKRRHLSIAELGILKQKYGLSMQAWVRRSKDLQIISEASYKSLCIEFSSKGWRKCEPKQWDYEGHEKPKRLVQMALRAAAEDVISREEADRICEDCGAGPMTEPERSTHGGLTPTELLKLPRAERAKMLAAAAASAEKEYRSNADLTDFNAFGEDDLHVEDETETG